MTIDKVVH